MIAFAMAGPRCFEINTGNHGNLIVAGSKNDPQVLLFLRISFHGIFFTAFLPCQLTFPVIDGSRFEYFSDLLGSNMTAVHTAPGMLTVLKVRRMAVQATLVGVTVGFLALRNSRAGTARGYAAGLPPA